ncbi:helix-turn-helix domain-containing protein [Acidovorax sp. NCPPB 3576]|uniref:helix-turn-helix domain-containing protein n=1 Tax=Acidovorax sp. NCPPB 3576 TaxID=2940488 RepID=UPI00234B5B42|nr:helix-turn-helix transcriptional regulator [Acidovorax sp. NCPPB 3576]WCM90607.1 helix-turn-helix domain-containing protein [Acidovorax sp. NCPPB 3576]
MTEFPVRTIDQLPLLIQAFRKQSGMTQAEVALRMGITQQALSSLERNASTVSTGRLFRLCSILGVEMVLRNADFSPPTRAPGAEPHW